MRVRWILQIVAVALLAMGAIRLWSARKPQPSSLEKKISEFRFDGVPLCDVMDFFQNVTGDQVLVNWEALATQGVNRDSPIDLQARDISLRRGLSAVLARVGRNVTFEIEGKIIRVAPADSMPLVVRVYDVADLVNAYRMIHAEVPTGGGIGGTSGGSGFVLAPVPDPDSIDALIMNAIEPDSWTGTGGHAAAWSSGDYLIVLQTRVAHDKIETLLNRLRIANSQRPLKRL